MDYLGTTIHTSWNREDRRLCLWQDNKGILFSAIVHIFEVVSCRRLEDYWQFSKREDIISLERSRFCFRRIGMKTENLESTWVVEIRQWSESHPLLSLICALCAKSRYKCVFCWSGILPTRIKQEINLWRGYCARSRIWKCLLLNCTRRIIRNHGGCQGSYEA